MPFEFSVDPNDGMQEEDLYGLLGASHEASRAEIRKGFLEMSLKWHPDKGTASKSRFLWVRNAYTILSDAGPRAFWGHRNWARRHREWQLHIDTVQARDQEKADERVRAEQEANRRSHADDASDGKFNIDSAEQPVWRTPDNSEDEARADTDKTSDTDSWGEWWNTRHDNLKTYFDEREQEGTEPEPDSEPTPKARPTPKAKAKAKVRAHQASRYTETSLTGFDAESILKKLRREAETHPELKSILSAS